MTVLLVLTLVVWLVSAAGLIIFVLLHSGKGTGLSEMLGGAMSTSSSGTRRTSIASPSGSRWPSVSVS